MTNWIIIININMITSKQMKKIIGNSIYIYLKRITKILKL